MDVTMLVGQKSVASLHEFTGPNGTGSEIPPVGAVQFTSSDPAVASVDATTGDVLALTAGTTVISGTDHGNGMGGSGTVTVTVPPPPPGAQSATLNFTTPV